MTNVSVKFLARFRELLGSEGLQARAQGEDVKSLLEALCGEFGDTFVNAVYDPTNSELKRDVLIMANGRNIVTIERSVYI